MKKYILFVFAKHAQQDTFVRMIADEILDVLGENEIKYYYGDENIVLTFDTPIKFEEVKDFISIIFSEQKIVHFLFPYDKDNIQFYLTDDLYDHLFGNNPMNRTGTTTKLNLPSEEDFDIFDQNMTDMEKNYYQLNEDDDDLELSLMKSLPPNPSLDELLDKISSQGISSLSSTEQILLKEYSK